MPSLSPAMPFAWRTLVWPTLFAAAAFIILIGLGAWQLQRLTAKELLLASIEARIHAKAEPVPPESSWPRFDAEADNYRRVEISGVFDHAKEALVFRSTGTGKAGFEGPGYLVLTPMLLPNGSHVFINRGFVPLAKRDPASRSAGQVYGSVTITGLLRPTEPRNSFTPADVPDKNEWYTRDPRLMAQHFKLVRTAPFTIDAEATPPNPGGLPLGGATVLAIPNDHFSYALTWFGLAMGLAGVYVAFCWSRLSGGSGRASQRA